MVTEIIKNPLDKISADGAVVFCFQGTKGIEETKQLKYLDKILKGQISKSINIEDFKGKEKSVFSIFSQKTLAPRIFVVGLGKKSDFNENILREAVGSFIRNNKKSLQSIVISLLESINLDPKIQAKIMMEGILLGSYEFSKYKKKESEKEFETVIFSEFDKNTQKEIKRGTEEATLVHEAIRLARDLVNEQAAVVTPTHLADIAKDLSRGNSEVKCKVYDKEEAEKMGMEAFLGVARGSDTPPKFIYLEYTPSGVIDKSKKLAIVGKGITFDTGGVSIKREDSMQTMKCDMAGAAVVLGVFSIISRIKPSYPVIGLIAATPNLISGKSLVPGDVLKAMNGKTIEVLNTDAEGRITMADSLFFAVKKEATHIIDLATLTGACEVALGTDIAGLLGNDKKFNSEVKQASLKAGEKLWELPLEKDYKDLNKSEVADISNIPSSRYGGTITAGLFLEEFVDGKPWVHLDIAGPAFAEHAHDLGPKGGTGFGVRTIVEMLKK